MPTPAVVTVEADSSRLLLHCVRAFPGGRSLDRGRATSVIPRDGAEITPSQTAGHRVAATASAVRPWVGQYRGGIDDEGPAHGASLRVRSRGVRTRSHRRSRAAWSEPRDPAFPGFTHAWADVDRRVQNYDAAQYIAAPSPSELNCPRRSRSYPCSRQPRRHRRCRARCAR